MRRTLELQSNCRGKSQERMTFVCNVFESIMYLNRKCCYNNPLLLLTVDTSDKKQSDVYRKLSEINALQVSIYVSLMATRHQELVFT